jgi:hypothetical protein
MNYHFNNQITNPEIIVADKVNFFADFFDYTLSNLGKPTFPSLENHRSLLEKIKFQLENYSSHSEKYLHHYFKNKYLNSNDLIIKEFYSIQLRDINLHKNFKDPNIRIILLNSITTFISILDGTLFKNSLSKIIECIATIRPLRKDIINRFKYFTPIIISEFIFAGFPQKDLEKLFDRILSTKFEIKNNKVRTEIPLPESLLKLKYDKIENPEVFYDKLSSYLKNRTLQQQFEGIYYLFKNSVKEKTFIFSLTNIKAHCPISSEFGIVKFSNQLRKETRIKRGTNKEYRTFYNGKGKLFAQLTLSENNDNVGKENAIRHINNALNYFNATLEKKARLDQDDFIVIDIDQNIRHKSVLIPINDDEIKKLADDSVYETLKNSNDKLVKKFYDLDKIYFHALNSDFKEYKIVNYWRFLESFFESENYTSKKVFNSISTILSIHCLPNFVYSFFSLAFRVLHHSYIKSPVLNSLGINNILNISNEELNSLMNPQYLGDINFKRLNEVINHPYVNERLSWFMSNDDQQKENYLKDFYNQILFETYEQRNFIEHSGIFMEKSIDRVLLSLPRIVKDFRSLIIFELEKGGYHNYNEILNKLSHK